MVTVVVVILMMTVFLTVGTQSQLDITMQFTQFAPHLVILEELEFNL